MNDLLHILLLAVMSAVNPALLAVVTAMLLFRDPKRLMNAKADATGAGGLLVTGVDGIGSRRLA